MNGGFVRVQPLKPPCAWDDEHQLKQLVDRLGLCVVLNRLGMICDKKAGHIAASTRLRMAFAKETPAAK